MYAGNHINIVVFGFTMGKTHVPVHTGLSMANQYVHNEINTSICVVT